MEKFGSEIMNKDDQEKMRQVLRNMEVKTAKKVSLKKLDNNKFVDGVTTSTGIWISPHLPKSRANYIRHQKAQEYWKHQKNKFNKKVNEYLYFYILNISLLSMKLGLDKVKLLRIHTAMLVLQVFFLKLLPYMIGQSIRKKQQKILRSVWDKSLATGA